MENLKRILIGEKTYPFKIDLNVLERIQEEFESISAFERALLGIRYKKDAEGKQLYAKNGEPIAELVEPSIEAIKLALVASVQEGIEIEADAYNKQAEQLTEQFIIANCTIPFDELSQMLHEEFKRCFVTKKLKPERVQRKKPR